MQHVHFHTLLRHSACVARFGLFQACQVPQPREAGRTKSLRKCAVFVVMFASKGSGRRGIRPGDHVIRQAADRGRGAHIRRELAELRQEHRDLDAAIAAMVEFGRIDTIRIQRMKKRKLALKDRIAGSRIGSSPTSLPDAMAAVMAGLLAVQRRVTIIPRPCFAPEHPHHDRADAAGRHPHGQPVGLGDAAPRRGYARFARHRAMTTASSPRTARRTG